MVHLEDIKRILRTLDAWTTDYEYKFFAVKAKGNSDEVATLRTDLDSLHGKFHSIQPFFTLGGDAEVTILQGNIDTVLSFIDLFRHPTM